MLQRKSFSDKSANFKGFFSVFAHGFFTDENRVNTQKLSAR